MAAPHGTGHHFGRALEATSDQPRPRLGRRPPRQPPCGGRSFWCRRVADVSSRQPEGRHPPGHGGRGRPPILPAGHAHGPAPMDPCLGNRHPLPRIGLPQAPDVDPLHLQHRLHDPVRLRGGRVLQHAVQLALPRSPQGRTGKIILDLDATDDPLHGHQEGRFMGTATVVAIRRRGRRRSRDRTDRPPDPQTPAAGAHPAARRFGPAVHRTTGNMAIAIRFLHVGFVDGLLAPIANPVQWPRQNRSREECNEP